MLKKKKSGNCAATVKTPFIIAKDVMKLVILLRKKLVNIRCFIGKYPKRAEKVMSGKKK